MKELQIYVAIDAEGMILNFAEYSRAGARALVDEYDYEFIRPISIFMTDDITGRHWTDCDIRERRLAMIMREAISIEIQTDDMILSKTMSNHFEILQPKTSVELRENKIGDYTTHKIIFVSESFDSALRALVPLPEETTNKKGEE